MRTITRAIKMCAGIFIVVITMEKCNLRVSGGSTWLWTGSSQPPRQGHTMSIFSIWTSALFNSVFKLQMIWCETSGVADASIPLNVVLQEIAVIKCCKSFFETVIEVLVSTTVSSQSASDLEMHFIISQGGFVIEPVSRHLLARHMLYWINLLYMWQRSLHCKMSIM